MYGKYTPPRYSSLPINPPTIRSDHVTCITFPTKSLSLLRTILPRPSCLLTFSSKENETSSSLGSPFDLASVLTSSETINSSPTFPNVPLSKEKSGSPPSMYGLAVYFSGISPIFCSAKDIISYTCSINLDASSVLPSLRSLRALSRSLNASSFTPEKFTQLF